MGWLLVLGSPFLLIFLFGYLTLTAPFSGRRVVWAAVAMVVAGVYALFLLALSFLSAVADVVYNVDLPTSQQSRGALTLADLCAKGFYVSGILALIALTLMVHAIVSVSRRR